VGERLLPQINTDKDCDEKQRIRRRQNISSGVIWFATVFIIAHLWLIGLDIFPELIDLRKRLSVLICSSRSA
jgi:hypothetical protein